MKGKRRIFTDAERVKIGLESLKGELTQSEIASKYAVQPLQVIAWKKKILTHLESTFSAEKKLESELRSRESLIEQLYMEVGKLKVENNFLKKKSAEFNL